MGARQSTLPRAFSLLDSEFNAFLFAPIGEEENHASLTVLSALSRQGIDPWKQAAGLSRLPREAAAQRLDTIIESLPDGNWSKAESAAIAARLVALLPSQPSFGVRLRAALGRVHPIFARMNGKSVR
jgi:hypothetical protein